MSCRAGLINCALVLFLSLVPGAACAVKAYPQAEGFGAETPAGRGGRIILVTNLNDSGPGSLREALYEIKGPRIVVFEVGGAIRLKSPLVIREPYVTLAGQTAPAPGITLVDFGLRVYTHDVLIQHLFVRLAPENSTGGGDGIAMKFNSVPDRPQNIIIDHCSISWANDENVSVFAGYGNKLTQNITISNCLLGEGHYGLLLAQSSTNVSVIRNLVMASLARFPRVGGGCYVNIVNNVFYNTPGSAFTVIGDGKEGPDKVTIVGNVYIPGPDTPKEHVAVAVLSTAAEGTLVYAPAAGERASIGTQMTRATDIKHIVGFMPVQTEGISILPAEQVERHIVNNAGARPAERRTIHGDPVDERFISELISRSGSVKNRTAPKWSPPQSSRRAFTQFLPSHPHADDDRDGFTNIEEVLDLMARELEWRP